MSAIRRECLAAKQWPTVIAEIIAAYAAHTLEECVALLIDKTTKGKGRGIAATQRMTVWWSAFDGHVSFAFGLGNTIAFGMRPEDIAPSIRLRVWQSVGYSPRNPVMSDEEADALGEWLATAQTL